MISPAALPDFFALVADAEGDMRRVYDHALLLHSHLSKVDPLTLDEQAALIWPAGDLLKAGRDLREHCDTLYEAAILYNAAARPKPTVDGTPLVDPSKLSIDQMFGLFDALGTINDVTSGLLCQPRFKHGGFDSVISAGEILDRLQAAIVDARDMIRREVLARKAKNKNDLARQVQFAAEEWVDGSCEPGPALKGLNAALTDLGKAVVK
jgi:hypothetical protein